MSNSVNNMEEFYKAREYEKEAYAIVGCFQLLRLAHIINEYVGDEGQTFSFLGGMDKIRTLTINQEAGRINIFTETIHDMFHKLSEKIESFQSITYGKTLFIIQTIHDFEIVREYYETICSKHKKDAIAINPEHSFYEEIMLLLPYDAKQKIENLKPQQKTIGERK